MYIYNLISVYKRSPDSNRLSIDVLGTFGDFDDARVALLEEVDYSGIELGMELLGDIEQVKTDCRLTDGEEGSVHLSIATSRINISN